MSAAENSIRWAAPAIGTVRKRQAVRRPSRTKSLLAGHSPPASQAGRRVGPVL